MRSRFGPPIAGGAATCSYSPSFDRPECDEPATLHLSIRDPRWGVVSLNACPEHEAIARGVGEVTGEHLFGGCCLTGECWS